jgi:Endonuclease NucS C-terminal domain
LLSVTPGRLAYEDMIQGWIEQTPELLGLNLLIIGREVVTTYGGSIDLLGIDDAGNIAIVELKRDRTPREIIAQVLDYASWVVTLKTRDIRDIAFKYLKRDLEIAFRERFGTTLPETLNENHTMVIIASAFDASSERIVRYLSETHDIAINTAFFSAFEDEGQTLLATDWLLDQEEVAERSEAKAKVNTAEILALAEDRKITKLVEICRQLSSDTEEKPAPAYGGSLRYWLKGKMVVGVNIAGGRRSPPLGELDVWLQVMKMAEVVSVPAEKIRQTLKREFAAMDAGLTECIVRIKSPQEAQHLVAVIREWIRTRAQESVASALKHKTSEQK